MVALKMGEGLFNDTHKRLTHSVVKWCDNMRVYWIARFHAVFEIIVATRPTGHHKRLSISPQHFTPRCDRVTGFGLSCMIPAGNKHGLQSNHISAYKECLRSTPTTRGYFLGKLQRTQTKVYIPTLASITFNAYAVPCLRMTQPT